MLLSKIENSERIESLHPKFKVLFDYIKNNDLLHKETGRIELDDNNLYINNVNSDMIHLEKIIMEVHRQYIDIHIPLNKTELIAWKPTSNCLNLKSEYIEKDDFELYNDVVENIITIHPGEFIIFFPEDAHCPLIGNGKIRKLIAKVKIEN